MRVFPEERRGSNDDIDTVNTGLDGDSRVVHVTSDVCEDLGVLEAEVADGFTVSTRFWRGGGRGQLNVLDSELVKPGD